MLWLNSRAAPTMGHAPLLLLFANQFCLSLNPLAEANGFKHE
jgi:hypothetical protein